MVVDEQGRRVERSRCRVRCDSSGPGARCLARARRPALGVTVMGAGDIGKHAVEAATKYGRPRTQRRRYGAARRRWVSRSSRSAATSRRTRGYHGRAALGTPTCSWTQLSETDPSRADRPERLRSRRLPAHAGRSATCVVDPYLLEADPPTVRGIEGHPPRKPRPVRVRRRRSGMGVPSVPASPARPTGGRSSPVTRGRGSILQLAWSNTAFNSSRSWKRSSPEGGSRVSVQTEPSTSAHCGAEASHIGRHASRSACLRLCRDAATPGQSARSAAAGQRTTRTGQSAWWMTL